MQRSARARAARPARWPRRSSPHASAALLGAGKRRRACRHARSAHTRRLRTRCGPLAACGADICRTAPPQTRCDGEPAQGGAAPLHTARPRRPPPAAISRDDSPAARSPLLAAVEPTSLPGLSPAECRMAAQAVSRHAHAPGSPAQPHAHGAGHTKPGPWPGSRCPLLASPCHAPSPVRQPPDRF